MAEVGKLPVLHNATEAVGAALPAWGGGGREEGER